MAKIKTTELHINHKILFNKHLKKIHNKSEEDRIRIMWIAVLFCMIIILGGWFIVYKLGDHKSKVVNEIPQMPSFSELQKNISGINKQKEDVFKEASDIIQKTEIESIALIYIKENELMSDNDILNLKLESIEKLENNWHLEYRQYYQDILVNDSNISFLIDGAEKKVISHSSNFDPDIELSSVEPKITKEEASEIAKKDLSESLNSDGNDNFDLKSSELAIYKSGNENGKPVEYYLTWKLNIFSLEPLCDYHYFIDTENGKIIFSF